MQFSAAARFDPFAPLESSINSALGPLESGASSGIGFVQSSASAEFVSVFKSIPTASSLPAPPLPPIINESGLTAIVNGAIQAISTLDPSTSGNQIATGFLMIIGAIKSLGTSTSPEAAVDVSPWLSNPRAASSDPFLTLRQVLNSTLYGAIRYSPSSFLADATVPPPNKNGLVNLKTSIYPPKDPQDAPTISPNPNLEKQFTFRTALPTAKSSRSW